MEVSTETKVNSFYAIISGLFRYEKKEIDEKNLFSNFFHWTNRINGGDYTSEFNYLKHSYYDCYLNNIYPEIRQNISQTSQLNNEFLSHLTLKDCLTKPKKFKSFKIQQGDKSNINFDIEYIDLYLFPNEIGIFSFKCKLNQDKEITIGEISGFINSIRQLNSIIELPETNNTITVKDFIEQYIFQKININLAIDLL